MEIRGVDDAIPALLARLQDGLPGQIDALNTAHPDDEVLPQPEQVLDYMPSHGGLQVFPTVAIGHGPGRLEDDSGWTATGSYDITILAFIQNADQRILAQQVRRYQLAVLRAIRTDPTTGQPANNLGAGPGIPWGVTVKALDFGPSLGQQPGPDQPYTAFLTWAAVVITCKLDED